MIVILLAILSSISMGTKPIAKYYKTSSRETVSSELFKANSLKNRDEEIHAILNEQNNLIDAATDIKRGFVNQTLDYIDITSKENRITVYYSSKKPELYCKILSKGTPHEVWYSAFKWCGANLGETLPEYPPSPPGSDDRGLLDKGIKNFK